MPQILLEFFSIIAGNRDFALDREWYDVNWQQTERNGREPVWQVQTP
jgi:hypothetical protein